jgi:hypothetical protein
MPRRARRRQAGRARGGDGGVAWAGTPSGPLGEARGWHFKWRRAGQFRDAEAFAGGPGADEGGPTRAGLGRAGRAGTTRAGTSLGCSLLLWASRWVAIGPGRAGQAEWAGPGRSGRVGPAEWAGPVRTCARRAVPRCAEPGRAGPGSCRAEKGQAGLGCPAGWTRHPMTEARSGCRFAGGARWTAMRPQAGGPQCEASAARGLQCAGRQAMGQACRAGARGAAGARQGRRRAECGWTRQVTV